jgi:hypothetical protein
MNTLEGLILRKVIDAIDSDDIEALANEIEEHLTERDLLKLQKVLKEQICRYEKNAQNIRHLTQLVAFIER